MIFGENLKKLRKERNWSQDALGEKIGIHGRHIGKYEMGKVMPNADTLIKLANLFKVSIDYLLLDEEGVSLTSNINDRMLLKDFETLDKMDTKDREIIKSLIDAYIKKHQLSEILNR